MKDETKNKISDNMGVIASVISPKVKAIIYTVATILIVISMITMGILGILAVDLEESEKIKNSFRLAIGILTFLNTVFVTIQQKFNGGNFKRVFSRNKEDKK